MNPNDCCDPLTFPLVHKFTFVVSSEMSQQLLDVLGKIWFRHSRPTHDEFEKLLTSI